MHHAEIVEADEWRPLADHVLALLRRHARSEPDPRAEEAVRELRRLGFIEAASVVAEKFGVKL